MRRVMVMVLLGLLWMPSVAAVLEDPQGDVDVQVMGQQTVAVPAGVRDGVDIVSLSIEEDAESFRFILGVKSIEDLMSDALEDKEILVFFSHGQMDYRLLHAALLPGADRVWLGARHSADLNYARLGELTMEVDRSANTFTYIVPRYDVPDEQGAPPTRGAILTDISVQTSAPVLVAVLSTGLYGAIVAYLVYGEPYIWILRDYAGRDAPGTYAVEFGVEQTGPGRLRADEPYRSSNGEAGTFVYWVEATHQGEGVGRYTLRAEDVPRGWVVQVPPGTLEIGRGDPVKIPVIVETAFAHSHGATEEFLLVLEHPSGGAGKLLMGIRYPEVPQPSGHHSTLFLHSGPGTDVFDSSMAPLHGPVFGNDGSEVAYMNALEEDPNDLGRRVDFGGCGGFVTNPRFCLHVPLEPRLQVGLDLRVGETGLLSVPLDSSAGSLTGVLGGFLQHYVMVEYQPCPECGTFLRAEGRTLATLEDSQPLSLGSSAQTVELVVRPTQYADHVPYDPAGRMRLVLNFTADQSVQVPGGLTPGVEPRLAPGGFMHLPLNEYRDRVGDLPSLGQDLVWTVPQRERLANPGDVILFETRLLNQGAAGDFALRLVGHNREWAALPGPQTVRLATNESIDVPVVVRVPGDTSLEATAELVLEAASTKDIARRSLVQLRTVLTAEEVEDDAARVDGLGGRDKKSPPVGAVLAGGLLLAALGRRRCA